MTITVIVYELEPNILEIRNPNKYFMVNINQVHPQLQLPLFHNFITCKYVLYGHHQQIACS